MCCCFDKKENIQRTPVAIGIGIVCGILIGIGIGVKVGAGIGVGIGIVGVIIGVGIGIGVVKFLGKISCFTSCNDEAVEKKEFENTNDGYAVEINSYRTIVKDTLDIINDRKWVISTFSYYYYYHYQYHNYQVVQLFILSAFLNSVSFLCIVAFYANNYDSKDAIYSIASYCPFLLKEVVLFFYMLSKGTKINTEYEIFISELSEKILSNSANSDTSSIEYTQTLTTIYIHALQNPIEFKFFGYRVTRGNLNLIIGGFLFTAIPLCIKVYNSSSFQEVIWTWM